MNRRIFTLAILLSAAVTGTAQAVRDTFFFDFGSDALTIDAKDSLNNLLYPLFAGRRADSIVIETHCDGIGSHHYNDRLSERRSRSVILYLGTLAGAADKLNKSPLFIHYAYGKRRPTALNTTAAGRQLNRRAIVCIYYHDTAVTSTPPAAPLATRLKTARPGAANIVLQNIQFIGGRHILLPAAYGELDTLLAVMLRHKALEIEIQGHICCQPGPEDAYDLDTGTNDLSVQRAKTVFTYLVRHGVAAGRMRYTGMGHRSPLTAERNEAERQQNRRVEIKIL